MTHLSYAALAAGLVALALAVDVPLSAGARTGHGAPVRRGPHTSAQQPRHNLYHVDIGVDTTVAALSVYKYVPDHLTIHSGDSVEWTNAVPAEPQTVTFGPLEAAVPLVVRNDVFEINSRVVRPSGGHVVGDVTAHTYSSGALMQGIAGLSNSYRFRFDTPGIYIYRSLFHPDSQGEIDVAPTSKPASPLHPDRGASMFDALRSASQALASEQAGDTGAAANSGNNGGIGIAVGSGNGDVSLNTFSPAGVTVRAGTTITWTVHETSGDPHVLVFNPTDADRAGPRFYVGLSSSGALQTNPAYGARTQIQGMAVTTGTVPAGGRIVSDILYGSSANAQAVTYTSYSLRFDLPGFYYYIDPFHADMAGAVYVLPN